MELGDFENLESNLTKLSEYVLQVNISFVEVILLKYMILGFLPVSPVDL